MQMGLGTRLDDDRPGEQVVVQLNFEPKGVGPLVAVDSKGLFPGNHRTTISEGQVSLGFLLWFEIDEVVYHPPVTSFIRACSLQTGSNHINNTLWVGAGCVDPQQQIS